MNTYIGKDGGIWQMQPEPEWSEPLDSADLSDEEKREASQRYILARYAGSGIYDQMIRRAADGPDPLVPEPGPGKG